MPSPLLLVELPATDRQRPEAAALLAACNSGLESGRCELGEQHSAKEALGLAIVSWRGGDELHALVEVARRRREGEAWLTEELTFQSQDALVERYRAIGLAVATQFREMGRPPPGATESSPGAQSREAATQAATAERSAEAPQQPVPKPATRPASTERPRALAPLPREQAGASRAPRGLPWLTAGATVGADVDSGLLRLGAGAGLFSAPLPWPVFFTVAARYERATLDPSIPITWLKGAVGVGGFLTLPARLRLSAQVAGVLESVSASTTDPALGRQDAAARGLRGIEGKASLIWPDRARFALEVGVTAERVNAATLVTLHRVPQATLGVTSFGAGLGLVLRPFGP